MELTEHLQTFDTKSKKKAKAEKKTKEDVDDDADKSRIKIKRLFPDTKDKTVKMMENLKGKIDKFESKLKSRVAILLILGRAETNSIRY